MTEKEMQSACDAYARTEKEWQRIMRSDEPDLNRALWLEYQCLGMNNLLRALGYEIGIFPDHIELYEQLNKSNYVTKSLTRTR